MRGETKNSELEIEANLIYENHNDLFAEGIPDRKLTELAAVVMGREIKKILGDNNTLYKRVNVILNEHISKADQSGFIRNMS